MNKFRVAAIVGVFALASIACGAIDTITGSETDLQTVSQLWSDVPRMDGLTPSDIEMPAFIKLLMRTVMSQVLAGGTGGGDWIAFNTDHSPDDVGAFYTNERMAGEGWLSSDNSTCLSGGDQGIAEVGLFCAFVKEEGGRQIGLMIIASPVEETQQTSVVFIRVENQATATP
jgi:hypothetical protein